VNKIFFFSPLIIQNIIWLTARLPFWLFCRLKVVGLDNFKNLPKGVVFVSNHSSELDPVLVPISFSFLSKFLPMFYTSRGKSFYKRSGWRQIFYGGLFFKVLGAHSVNSGSQDYNISLSSHIYILERQHSLLIFPEGRITTDGSIKFENAHGGTAFLVERTGLPAVPVLIQGVFKMSLKDFFFRRRHITVSFGKPVYAGELFENLSPDDTRYRIASRRLLERVSGLQQVEEDVNKFVAVNPNLGKV